MLLRFSTKFFFCGGGGGLRRCGTERGREGEREGEREKEREREGESYFYISARSKLDIIICQSHHIISSFLSLAAYHIGPIHIEDNHKDTTKRETKPFKNPFLLPITHPISFLSYV